MLPIQPIITDEHGTERFRANEIVRYLLDNGGIDLNALARKGFNEEDWTQFAQLIGYSICGWSELSYVSDDDYSAVQKIKEGRTESDARIESLTESLNDVREKLKPAVTALYRIHEDDLEG